MSASEICGDNRFELIAKYHAQLLDNTDIEDSPEEMAVINSVLFRFWQMGWLDRLEMETNEQHIYDRCIIRVGQLETENEKLKELVRDA